MSNRAVLKVQLRRFVGRINYGTIITRALVSLANKIKDRKFRLQYCLDDESGRDFSHLD